MDLERVLRQRFGHPAFREGQKVIVQHLVDGEDALVVMPTGAGKSLCYQLPAVARGGTTIVVSPLLALMKDQVDSLVAAGVKATFINSTLSPEERRARLSGLHRGEWELVYVAPERFSPGFLRAIAGADIRLLAVDEAHCVSQWGHDFRPDYLRLAEVRQALGHPPTVALTATATVEVQEDIVRSIGIPDCRRFVQGFDRPNLSLEVMEVGPQADKLARLPALVFPGPALVYCATRRNVEAVYSHLLSAGIPAGKYHGGMAHHARVQVQDDFMSGRIPVVAATNAFGMGVDKDNVRAIVHFDIPGTVEAYYQEIGRAGRDGKPSRVVLMYRDEDRRTQEFFITMAHPEAELVRAVWSWLCERGENPVWLDRQSLAVELREGLSGIDPDRISERTVDSCIYVLQREGAVRPIAPTDRPGHLELNNTAPKARPPGLMARVWDLVLEEAEIAATFGRMVTIDPVVAARSLQAAPDQVEAALQSLDARGFLTWHPPSRSGGIEVLVPHDKVVIDEARSKEKRARDYARLERMMGYGRAGCRRLYLLEYFGQKPPWERCGTCDACREGRALVQRPRRLLPDEDVIARQMLSCLVRMGRPSSISMIVKVMRGQSDNGVVAFRYDRLSTFGLQGSMTAKEVEAVLSALVQAGAMEVDFVTRRLGNRDQTYKELWITELGREVMHSRIPEFEMSWPVKTRPPKKAASARTAAPAANVNQDLLAELKDLRSRLARANDVPAYVVAPNRTLEDMASKRPMNRKAMLEIHGMGEVRYQRYGQTFLTAVREWTGC